MGPKVWWHRFAKVVRDTGTKVAPHLSKVTSKVTTPAPSVTILIPAVQSSLPKSHKASKCYTTLLTQLAHESGTQAKPPAEASTAGEASVGARCLCVRGERGWRPGGNRFIIGAHGWAGRRLVMTRNLNCVYWRKYTCSPYLPSTKINQGLLKCTISWICTACTGKAMDSVCQSMSKTKQPAPSPTLHPQTGSEAGKAGRDGGVVGNQATKSRCGPHSLSTLEK